MCTAETDLRIPGTPKGKPAFIRVNGKQIKAYKGESVLAALTAAGIIHLNDTTAGEPTGALCGMGICYQCLVTIDGVPDCRACMAQVRDGMQIITRDNPGNAVGARK